jgi:hypothetical protein
MERRVDWGGVIGGEVDGERMILGVGYMVVGVGAGWWAPVGSSGKCRFRPPPLRDRNKIPGAREFKPRRVHAKK